MIKLHQNPSETQNKSIRLLLATSLLGVLYYQPKQCTIKGEVLQIYHTIVVFHSPQMGNLMNLDLETSEFEKYVTNGLLFPKHSMYGIFIYIYPRNYPNVSK